MKKYNEKDEVFGGIFNSKSLADRWEAGEGRFFEFEKLFLVDIVNLEDAYLIKAEMPGLKREEINIEVFQNTITISTEQEVKEEEKSLDYIYKESKRQCLSRTIYLRNMNENEVDAKLEDGVLNVRINKLDDGMKLNNVEVK